MRRVGRQVAAILLICSFLVGLCSCGARREADGVLSELLAVSSLGRGVVYSSRAAAGDAGYASESLLSALYGEASISHEFKKLESFAIYSSGRMELCEVAVFCCVAASDTDLLARMCHSRIEHLTRYLAAVGENAPQMRVWVRGRWVFMAVCAEADTLMKHSSRVLARA